MKRILSLLMAMVLCLGLTVTAFAAESPTPEGILPTVNVSWNEDTASGWGVTLDEVKGTADASLWYQIDLFCNGEICMRYEYAYQEDAANVVIDVSADVSKAGDYTARAVACMKDTSGNTIYGTPSVTEAKTYVKPEKALGRVTGTWSDEKDKVLLVPSVEDAWVYECSVYVHVESTTGAGTIERVGQIIYGNENDRTFKDTAGKTYEIDCSEYMVDEGVYYVIVRALSGDTSEIAHGAYGEASEFYFVEGEEDTNDKPIEGFPVPNIKWAEDGSWAIVFDRVEGSSVDTIYYEVSYWIGEECVGSSAFGGYRTPQENMTYSVSADINESGAYKVKVRSYRVGTNNGAVYGEYAETGVKEYVKPGVTLGTTVGQWDDARTGVFVFDGVEDAWKYECTLYKMMNGRLQMFGRRIVQANEATEAGNYEADFSTWLTIDGEYRVAIRALSGDIDVMANGVEGEMSKALYTGEVADKVEGVVGGANDYEDAAEGLDYLVENTTTEQLKAAMQTDADVRAKIAELEENYKTQEGINVIPPVVSEEAEAFIDADKITMVGAALNAASGEEVKLAISTPATLENLDSKYENPVQLDIELFCGGSSVSELTVPVTITMPIPTGVNVHNLRILHYHEHAGSKTVESVQYSVDTVNNTITFTVDGFSTFVFANEAVQNTPVNPDNSGADDVVATSPKTGDNSMIWMAGVLVVVLVSVVMVRKRAY